MKKLLVLMFSVVLIFMLSTCGEKVSNNKEVATDTPSNELIVDQQEQILQELPKDSSKMSRSQYNKAAENINDFFYKVLSFSEDLVTIVETYPEVVTNETVDLLQFSIFATSKDDLNQTIQDIQSYDTSELSDELKVCFKELLSYAQHMYTYAEELSNELSHDEFVELICVSLVESQNEHTQKLGTLFVIAGKEFDKENSKPTSESDGFSNKFGTSTTECAHTGCANYIASSGDTNCCVTHSNHCLNCNKYIDEDAMYCMDCLTAALN